MEKHPAGDRAGIEDSFVAPLWYPQQHEWVVNPQAPENCAYNYAIPLRVHGQVDPCILKDALQKLASRHQVLRSRFRSVDGELIHVIDRSVEVRFALEDLSNLSKPESEAIQLRVLSKEANRAFDLTRSPLLRATLVNLGAEQHILLLVTHHAVVDDWSTGIMLHELASLYEGLSMGNTATLANPTFQYSDFVRWQQNRFQASRLTRYRDFWKKEFANGANFHHLAPDHARPSPSGFVGTHVITNLPEQLASAVVALARRERATPFMVLATAFQCLLHLYSGDEQIGLASCSANRVLLETEQLVGPLSNRVVIHTDFSGQPTTVEALRRTRERVLTTNPYEDLPFGALVKQLKPIVPPGQNPLFQVLMVLQNAPKPPSHSTFIHWQPFPLDEGTTRYDLNVWLTLDNSLKVDLQYNTALFDSSTMRLLLSDYAAILEAMVCGSALRVDELPIASRRRGSFQRTA